MGKYFCKIAYLAVMQSLLLQFMRLTKSSASDNYNKQYDRIETCVFNRSWQKGTGNCQDFQEQIRGLKENAWYYGIGREMKVLYSQIEYCSEMVLNGEANRIEGGYFTGDADSFVN